MKIYGFASDTLTNIWAGIGAGMWAVGGSEKPSFKKGRLTKAAKMPIGAFGILYCKQTKSFTTPFVVYSHPDPDVTVTDVWSDPWVLPFKIKPLGNPTQSMTVSEMKKLLPSVARKKIANPLTHLIRIQGNFAFQPSEIADDDWMALIEKLAI